MSGGSEVIQEFLVAIRYEEQGREKFLGDLANMAKAAVKFAASIEAAALGAVVAVAKIAAGFEQLYFASQRVGASVENIKAMSYAVSQMGGSAEGALQALEGMGRFLRSNPGSETFIASLGVGTRDAGGKVRDTTEMMSDLATKWKAMPFFQAQAQASIFGIDERTLMALMQGTSEFSDQLKGMYRAAGVDSQQAAESSRGFMVELRLMIAAFGVLKDRVMTDVAGKMTAAIARFRGAFVEHFGDISKAITWVSEKLLVAGEFIGRFAGRYADAMGQWLGMLGRLGESFKTLGLTLAGLVAGVTLLAYPAAGVAALAASIFMLWEDYDTWRKGGQSLIDWDKWEPSIKAAQDAIAMLTSTISDGLTKALHSISAPDSGFVDFFADALPRAIKATTAAIFDMSKMLSAVMRMLAAVAKGDVHAALAAAADFNIALGITNPAERQQTPSASAADEAMRRDGQQNWWQRHAPRWLGGAQADPAKATATGPGGTSRVTGSSDRAAFIAKWRPEAERISAQVGTGADNILAHWGQETGWGAHEHDNNVGNLQALRAGANTVTRGDTHGDGTAYQAPFFSYSSAAESADAYASWIVRHGAVGPGGGDDATAFGSRLRGAHYMENPNAPADIARARATLGPSGTVDAQRVATMTGRVNAPGYEGRAAYSPIGSTSSSVTNNRSSAPVFNQTVNITANGGGSGGDVSKQVQTGLRSANQSAIRNLAAAVT